jgi:hypothetical protein
MGDNKTLQWWDEWAPRQRAADGRVAPHGKSLAIEAMRMLPTPTVQDGENTAGPSQFHRNSLPLNTFVVALQTGVSTSLPSDGGNTPSGDRPPNQLNQETTGNPD